MNRFMDFCLQHDSTKGPHLVKILPTPPRSSHKCLSPQSPPSYSATPEPLAIEDLDPPFPEPLTHCSSWSYHHSQDHSELSLSLETICGSSHHLEDHEYREIKGGSEASRCKCHICYHRFGYEPTIKAKCQNCDTALCNKCYMRILGHTGFPEPYGSDPWLRADLD